MYIYIHIYIWICICIHVHILTLVFSYFQPHLIEGLDLDDNKTHAANLGGRRRFDHLERSIQILENLSHGKDESGLIMYMCIHTYKCVYAYIYVHIFLKTSCMTKTSQV